MKVNHAAEVRAKLVPVITKARRTYNATDLELFLDKHAQGTGYVIFAPQEASVTVGFRDGTVLVLVVTPLDPVYALSMEQGGSTWQRCVKNRVTAYGCGQVYLRA